MTAVVRTVVVWLIATMVGGCSSPGPAPPESVGERRHGGTVYFRVPGFLQITSLDPLRASDISVSSVAGSLYEGLLGYEPGAEGELTPALAESWEISGDRRIWTITLRDGVRFHDDTCFPGGAGRRVTAEDVRYSVLRSIGDSPSGSPLPLRDFIIDSDRIAAGDTAEVSGVEVLDERRIRFTLREPRNAFPHALAGSAAWIVPREAVERYGSGFGRHPVGTGPFRVADWNRQEMMLVRNEHYWKEDERGDRLPYLDGIVLRRGAGGASNRSTINEVLSGKNHFFYYTGEHDISELSRLAEYVGTRGATVHQTTKLNTIFLGWNLKREGVWATHPSLRAVVAAAIARPDESILIAPASGLLPPGLSRRETVNRTEPRGIETARQLLHAAGFPDGTGLPPLRVGLIGVPTVVRTVDYSVHQALRPLEALGVEIDFHVGPRQLHWEAVRRGEFDLFRDGWIADYPDPENFYELFYTSSPGNRSGHSNADYDRLYENLVGLAPSDPARDAICARLDEILRDGRPAIFLYHEKSLYFVNDSVGGFEVLVNPFERKFYERLWLRDGRDR